MRTIHIRNVPKALHRRLETCAACSGMTLSEFLLRELSRIAAMSTRVAVLERLHSRSRVKLSEPAARIIRRQRGLA